MNHPTCECFQPGGDGYSRTMTLGHEVGKHFHSLVSDLDLCDESIPYCAAAAAYAIMAASCVIVDDDLNTQSELQITEVMQAHCQSFIRQIVAYAEARRAMAERTGATS